MARNSLYGGYLNRIDDTQSKIPNWVFNSDYGELDRQLQNADQQAWQTETARQNAYNNQYQNEILQEKIQREDALNQAFRNSPPATIREAYSLMLQKAQDMGDYEDIVSGLSKLEKLDEAERDKRFSDITSAYNMGRIDPKLADEYLAAHGQDYKFNPKVFERKTGFGFGGRPGAPKGFYNPDTNDAVFVDANDYDKQELLVENGYIPGLRAPQEDPFAEAYRKAQEEDRRSQTAEAPIKQQKQVSKKVIEENKGGPVSNQVEIRIGKNGQPIKVIKNSARKD